MRYILIFYSFFLFACNRQIIKEDYFDNGVLKQKSFFLSERDTVPYMIMSYYENGVLKDSSNYNSAHETEGWSYFYDKDGGYWRRGFYENGKRNGNFFVYLDNGIKIHQHYQNDTLSGIIYVYDSEGKLIDRTLVKENRPLLSEEIKYLNIGDSVGFLNSFESERSGRSRVIEDNGLRLVNCVNKLLPQSQKSIYGSAIFRGNDVDRSFGVTYCKIKKSDSIRIGQQLDIGIEGYIGNLEGRGTRLVVTIGDLDMQLGFKGKVIEANSPLDVHKFNISIGTDVFFKLGYNLLTGRILVLRGDEVLYTFYFFEDFYLVNP